jgi:hypothetical protein
MKGLSVFKRNFQGFLHEWLAARRQLMKYASVLSNIHKLRSFHAGGAAYEVVQIKQSMVP